MAYPQQQQQNNVVEHGREPCPDRIIDDIGGAFGMGAIGGGFWNTYKGLKNSPRGYKMLGTLEVLQSLPVTGAAAHCCTPPFCVLEQPLGLCFCLLAEYL